MSKKVYEIGQKIEFVEDYEIEKAISKDRVQVKKGDKAIITSGGFAKHLNGNAKGMIQKLADVEVEGYDRRSIAEVIYQRINCVYGLENFLDDEEIEFDEFIDEIEDALCDIL